VALAFKNLSDDLEDTFNKVYDRLAETRPTAVNLFWALNKMREVFNANKSEENLYKIMLETAKEIHEDDVDKCSAIGRNGLEIFKKKSVVLTHCNTGQLATGGSGTAFSVILEGFKNGLVEHVYADETRPLLQGSRLTAFELDKAGIPFSVNTDSMAAELMQKGRIDLVITGADRVAKNGDSANKIGTYSLAVLAKYHNIPFYIAAPTSTIDLNCPSGREIKIEQRDKSEVNRIKETSITRQNYNIYSPAFDVTPAELIHGIITEEKVHKPPYDF
jgi:methylthioribose-1-phosphate isomerase